MENCDCEICKRTKKFISIIKDLSLGDKEFMEKILDDLICAEEYIDFKKWRMNENWKL